ncbi:MAG: glycoside hydrolase family 2 [Kiritimatiellaeota bacterium]|nr:glycoside hydrolase family 2 [Kiritimatiellota bacterium]
MRTVSLNGPWKLSYGPQTAEAPETPDTPALRGWPTIPAQVPGNVEIDLMRAGVLSEIETGNRVYETREFEMYRWWYRRTFESPEHEPGDRVELVLRGVDCLAVVFVNGHEVGRCDNMFITWRFDITDHLCEDASNHLAVRLDSAVLAGRRAGHEVFEQHFVRTGWESLHVRKAPHMYGWDILPRIVSAGLWRDVQIEVRPPTHWRSVYWTTRSISPGDRTAALLVDWDFETDRLGIDDLTVRVTIGRNGNVVHRSDWRVSSTHERTTLNLRDVDPWWPRNMGDPVLYEATLELLDADGTVLDARRSRIGLRSIELKHTEISTREEPGEFVFIVNGERVFIKGTNWVPLDSLHSRDAGHLKAVFDMVVDLNCNMVRCWGGNVYEDHPFFDLCDENGVMVWQDFAFACGVYPQTDAFAAAAAREAEAVVCELRNHPSLALWAGNNENDMAMMWGGLNMDPNRDRISREVLPDVCRRFDPFRPYLPSSPYVGPEVFRRRGGQEIMSEVHLWRRPYPKDPFYRDSAAVFVSEIGFHGCPVRETLEQMLDPDSLWPWQENDQWRTKAVRPLPWGDAFVYRIPLMAEKIERMFGAVPEDLDDFILASQIAQAEAVKFFIEWWRIHKWNKTGILWWNLRDGWPIFSDAVVDFYNRKKLAYWYIKRVQTDVAAIVGEPSAEGRHPVVVINDTREAVAGTVRVRDTVTEAVLLEAPFHANPNGRMELGSIPHPENRGMWTTHLAAGRFQQTNHYLVGTPPFDLATYHGWLLRAGLLDPPE